MAKPMLAFTAPVLSTKLSAALGQRSHVQQVYLTGIFPSRTAYIRAIRETLAGIVEPPLRDRVDDGCDSDEPEGTFYVTAKDVVTVGGARVELVELLAKL
ncbi:hypothetical protein GCM10025867_46340 (plasmid) [Frondihabitans sucicola]|uniref:Uncharacterized protein n=1 Tax=Frondihabitans sucicola TaxID=1268041 RepID=A0ABN6Y5E8_9MICO|nr:hypothetical protein [Frondihabitans sucicola]BDZ52393.1 hypothetical protein GCM10025867_46340 [Frondihabitans sucicola]